MIKRDQIITAIGNLLLLLLDFSHYCFSDNTIDVTAAPSVFDNDSTWVTVSVKGVSSPENDDWIGLFSLKMDAVKVDPKIHAPVKFKVCACIKCTTSAFYYNGMLKVTG